VAKQTKQKTNDLNEFKTKKHFSSTIHTSFTLRFYLPLERAYRTLRRCVYCTSSIV